MPQRKLPADDVVVGLYRSGLSCPEIAERFGVAHVTVTSLLRRIGEPRRSASEAARLSLQAGRSTPRRPWLGKKQPAEMVERRVSKIRGERHYLWKGGVERRPYRAMVDKDRCAVCGTQEDLCIHHIDLDYYHNEPSNLQILCTSHHLSIHKKAYWDAWRAGSPTPKSSGPSHWRAPR